MSLREDCQHSCLRLNCPGGRVLSISDALRALLPEVDVEALALLHDHAAYALMHDEIAAPGLVALSHVIDAFWLGTAGT